MDFDGTLVNDNKEIRNDHLNILKNFLLNNKICIVSSEPYQSLLNFKNKYNLNIDIFSSSSGISTINGETIINNLPSSVINLLFETFENSIYTAYGESLDKSFVYNYQERLEALYPKQNRETITYLEYDVSSFTFAISNTITNEFIELLNQLNIDYKIIAQDKNRDIFQIYRNNISKVDAYYLIKKAYPNKKIVGISDSYYDFDMMEKCDIKVAMINGDDKLKFNCDCVTQASNNEGGAILILNDICNL
jgi:HAD superfamily hydrolase (TIGR01484 family)